MEFSVKAQVQDNSSLRRIPTETATGSTELASGPNIRSASDAIGHLATVLTGA